MNALDLSAGDTSGMWQINYPFPYKDESVAGRFRDLSDLLLRAYEAETPAERKTSLEAYLSGRSAFAESLKPADYRYASFQLWQEGVSRYTQFRMAELAGRKVKPSRGFRELQDFVPFDKEAERLLAATLDEMRKLDLRTWERTVFYPFGAVEALLLDRLDPKWREKYLADKFVLERFYPKMTAQ